MKKRKSFLVALLAALTLSGLSLPTMAQKLRSPGKSHGEEKFFVNWKHYPNYEEMTTILRGLAEKFPHLAKLRSTGKSRQGRELWIMEITNPKTGDPLDKPGFYIDGNIHGNEVNGMTVPLYTCWYLLTHYGHDSFVTDLVDRIVFYIRPSVNPDAMNSFISEPNTMHHPRWNYRPIDNDGDGLFDEDPEEDLNGDGEISLMRKRDPNGRWKISPEDPRLMVRVGPDDPPGGWTLLGTEGIDNDNDGRLNEDLPGGLDLARNFPYDYKIQNGWPYPLSEPETRGVIEFFRDHPNIAFVFHYHNTGQLIMLALGPVQRPEQSQQARSRGRQRGPALPELTPEQQKLMERILNLQVERNRQEDLFLYQSLAAKGVQMLHYRPTTLGGVGQFPPWTYMMYGAPSILIELWGIPGDYNKDGSVSQKEALRWIDEELHGEGWVDWKPFHHPQFGEIEIGGNFQKFVRRTPPARFLEEHCRKNMDFHLYVASQLPQLKITRLDFEPIAAFARAAAGEVTIVKASTRPTIFSSQKRDGVLGWLDIEIKNLGLIPTSSAQARLIKAVRPDRLILETSSTVDILARSNPPNNLGKISHFTSATDHILDINYFRGYESKSFRFLVRVVPGSEKGFIRVTVDSQRGGKMTQTIPISLK